MTPQEVDETSSKMLKTEDSYVQFTNASNRYRVSLWKDVLDIINSTMEKVETGSEVLLRGGERRDMLLVNAEKSIRVLSSNVADLQRIAQVGIFCRYCPIPINIAWQLACVT